MSAIRVDFDQRTFRRDVRALERKLGRLRERVVPRATVRALNYAAGRGRTQTTRALARELAVPQKVIRGRVQVFRANLRRPVATLWIGTKVGILVEHLPGAQFILTGKHAGTLKAGRVTARPFRARLRSGKVALFVRRDPGLRRTAGRPVTSSPNLPIERPTIRLMPAARPILEHTAREAMRADYPREYRRLLTAAVHKMRV